MRILRLAVLYVGLRTMRNPAAADVGLGKPLSSAGSGAGHQAAQLSALAGHTANRHPDQSLHERRSIPYHNLNALCPG